MFVCYLFAVIFYLPHLLLTTYYSYTNTMQKTYHSASTEETIAIGEQIGSTLKGGEVIELISDLGGGKTTFVKGLAKGFGSEDPVASPSFTISHVYRCRDNKELHHFDFYRLQDAGVVGSELAEVIGDAQVVTVIEWGDIIHDILPSNRFVVRITAVSDTARKITITNPGDIL